MGPLQSRMLFVSSEIKKENTTVPVPWLLNNIPSTGALLRMEWILHVLLSGISRGGGQAGAPRFPGHRAAEQLSAHSLQSSESPWETELIPERGTH